jgi:hypothetical protein
MVLRAGAGGRRARAQHKPSNGTRRRASKGRPRRIPAVVALSDRNRILREPLEPEVFRKEAAAGFRRCPSKGSWATNAALRWLTKVPARFEASPSQRLQQVFDPGGLTLTIDDLRLTIRASGAFSDSRSSISCRKPVLAALPRSSRSVRSPTESASLAGRNCNASRFGVTPYTTSGDLARAHRASIFIDRADGRCDL